MKRPDGRAAVRAEWVKLWSTSSGAWSVVAVVGSTVLITAFFCAVGSTNASQPGQGDDDVVVNSLRGVHLGQIAAVVLGVQIFAAEHATGLIRATFAALPRRGTVLAAKAGVVTVVGIAAGSVASVLSFLVAQPLLHNGGFVPPAYPLVGLNDPSALRAVVGTALFLTALALLGLAAGAVLRNGGVAISLLSGVLLLPLVLGGLLPETATDTLRRLTPSAGLAIQHTAARAPAPPIGPWAGLAVTWTWAAGALIGAWLVLRHRDA